MNEPNDIQAPRATLEAQALRAKLEGARGREAVSVTGRPKRELPRSATAQRVVQ